MRCDIAVIGGSLGGVQAALKACSHGKDVILTEETDWLGGQLTSQAVPPDEHKWIERFGATKGYLEYRQKVRAHYRSLPNASAAMREADAFCPGASWVSRLSHEPKVALSILNESLAPYVAAGKLRILYRTSPVAARVSGNEIRSVTVRDAVGKTEEIEAAFFLDATDCGDLLPLAGAEYRTGAEAKSETGELHAPETADPEDMQPATWVVALEMGEGNGEAIEKPEMYDYFAGLGVPYDDNKLLSWYAPDEKTQRKKRFSMFNGDLADSPLGLWEYRRIIAKCNYENGVKEVSLINWPANDFALGNLYGTRDAERNRYLARQQTLSLLYWLQTAAPRADGGTGYPVRPRGDITGTPDGLAKSPYIRESRRIVAKNTICEQNVSRRNNSGIIRVPDSVGVGHYAIDIHMTTKSHRFLYDATYPFEIPLSAMVPVRLVNLLPACKNIGATHLTNGCYRLHPVEWNVGEVAGHLAAYCLENKCTPEEVAFGKISDFQELLHADGVQLHWDESQMEL